MLLYGGIKPKCKEGDSMALIKCPGCGKEISDKAKKCVHCGYMMGKKEEKPEIKKPIRGGEKTDVKVSEENGLEKEMAAYKRNLEKEYQDRLSAYKMQTDLDYQKKLTDAQRKMEAELNDRLSSYKQQIEKEYLEEKREYEKRIKDNFDSKIANVSKELEKQKIELNKESEANRVKYEARQKIALDDYKKQTSEEIETKYNQKYEEEMEKHESEKAELLKLVDELTKGNDSNQTQKENEAGSKGKKIVPVLTVLCAVLLIVNVVQFVMRGIANKEVRDSNEITQVATVTDEQESDTQVQSEENSQKSNESSEEETAEEAGDETNTVDTTTPPEDSILSYKCIADGLTDNCVFAGVYKCGTDIEPGKYAFLSMINSSSYTISNDAMKEDIIEEESTSFKIIDLQEGNYIDIGSGAVIIPEQELDQKNLQKYGIFTVGEDIEPGEYKIKDIAGDCKTADGETWGIGSGAYEIRNDVFVTGEDGMQYLNGDQTYIALKEGQYLILRCGAIFPA